MTRITADGIDEERDDGAFLDDLDVGFGRDSVIITGDFCQRAVLFTALVDEATSFFSCESEEDRKYHAQTLIQIAKALRSAADRCERAAAGAAKRTGVDDGDY